VSLTIDTYLVLMEPPVHNELSGTLTVRVTNFTIDDLPTMPVNQAARPHRYTLAAHL
jgi:hypothetical protein